MFYLKRWTFGCWYVKLKTGWWDRLLECLLRVCNLWPKIIASANNKQAVSGYSIGINELNSNRNSMDILWMFISWTTWQRRNRMKIWTPIYVHSMMILFAIVISLSLWLLLKHGTDWESQYILLFVLNGFKLFKILFLSTAIINFYGNDTGLSSFHMQIVTYVIWTLFAFDYSRYLSGWE